MAEAASLAATAEASASGPWALGSRVVGASSGRSVTTLNALPPASGGPRPGGRGLRSG